MVFILIFLSAVYHPEFPSVLTALEIDHPMVANCLIDARGIETVLLIKVRDFKEKAFSLCMKHIQYTFTDSVCGGKKRQRNITGSLGFFSSRSEDRRGPRWLSRPLLSQLSVIVQYTHVHNHWRAPQ